MKTSQNTYDVIIIGSGIGGLTTGSLLAQLKNKRVLILERNFKIGGFTHIFKRNSEQGSYKWDVGLHYVGNMKQGEMPRAIFDFITRGGVTWNKMPENYDTFIYPEFTFKARAGKDTLLSDLIVNFPEEEQAIKKYFQDVEKAGKWLGRYNAFSVVPPYIKTVTDLISRNSFDYSKTTLKEYLDENFTDSKLKAVLASQWGDYGLPPSKASFVIHAVVASHYFEGGYYPVGGAKTIADSVEPIIEEKGGKILANHEVRKIIVDDWKAVGVEVVKKMKDGTEVLSDFYADTFISNAGAEITYRKLLTPKYSKSYTGELIKHSDYTGHVTLHLGLKESAEKLGVKGENLWIYDSYDHEKNYSESRDIVSGLIHSAFVSFPGLKDLEGDGRTVEVIAFAAYDQFSKWKDQPWKKRDENYQQLKNNISNTLIEFVEKQLPGFKEMIDYQELSTPLSTEFFTGNKFGNIYGVPATPERYKNPAISVRTPLKNLFLSGADTTAGHGIVGAMMGGALAAGAAMGGLGIMKIFNKAMKFSNSASN